MAESFQLLFDRFDEARVLMPGVDHRDAGAEIDIAFAVLTPDLGILRRLGEDLRHVSDATRNGSDATGLEFG